MAKIHKGSLLRNIIKKLGLQPGAEAVPTEIIDKVMPTIEVGNDGIFRLIRDTTLNNSSKDFVVPLGFKWKLHSISGNLIPSGVAGNRRMAVQIIDPNTNIVYISINNGSIPASVTTQFTFQGDAIETTVLSLGGFAPLYPGEVPGGFTVRVLDFLAVDAAADDMTVNIMYDEFEEAEE